MAFASTICVCRHYFNVHLNFYFRFLFIHLKVFLYFFSFALFLHTVVIFASQVSKFMCTKLHTHTYGCDRWIDTTRTHLNK